MSSFGTRLARLLQHKGTDVDAMSSYGGLDLKPVIEGLEPSTLLLERLAPVLGLHVQDVFVLAGVALPEELAALDPAAGTPAIDIAFATMSLTVERIREFERLVKSLPQEERRKPASPSKRYGPGTGSFLLGMLDNRNLARHHTAKALYLGSGGGLYLSEEAVRHALVRDRPLTPDQFAGFARVLGIPMADLAILTGFDQPLGNVSEESTLIMAVELLWELCRLSAEQARHVADIARSMLTGG